MCKYIACHYCQTWDKLIERSILKIFWCFEGNHGKSALSLSYFAPKCPVCSTEIIARRLNSDNIFSPSTQPSPPAYPSLAQNFVIEYFPQTDLWLPASAIRAAQPSPAGVIGSDLRSWELSQLLPDRWPAPLYWAAGQRRGGVQGWCWPVVCQCTHPASRCGLGWAGMPRLVRPLSSPRTTTQSTAASLAASTLPPAGRHTLGVLIEWNSLSKGIKVDLFFATAWLVKVKKAAFCSYYKTCRYLYGDLAMLNISR